MEQAFSLSEVVLFFSVNIKTYFSALGQSKIYMCMQDFYRFVCLCVKILYIFSLYNIKYIADLVYIYFYEEISVELYCIK